MFFKKDDFSTALHKEILMFIGTIFSMLQITTGDGWVTDIVRPMNTGEVKKKINKKGWGTDIVRPMDTGEVKFF